MTITTETQLCGVLGNPVHHSLSPAIHNAAFHHLGLNFVYLALPVTKDVEGAIRGVRALGNLRGFSVTIPHKVAVMPYLDEIDATARHIGSVNTIVKEQDILTGYNTDATGALQALRLGGAQLKGQSILLLGSGGAARAIAFGLAVEGEIEHLTILGIDEAERASLVNDLRERTAVSVDEAAINQESLESGIADSHVLIHCTPIGMHPHVDNSCVDKALLTPNLIVMDIVYNPLETQLLRDAREAGCNTIRGVEMFVNQAVGQFERWTGQPAPVDVMRAILEEHFR
ncbi:MAG: shikimate dehydrogenase (NADP(+)) [Nitrospirales bacterium]|nr:MAG: shikimate dehydrogenase (NADP(+)) [Nitrospirales bacterium]